MTLILEAGLTELPDGNVWNLGGLTIGDIGLRVIEDDLEGGEVASTDVDAASDGAATGVQRIPTRIHSIHLELMSPPGTEDARAAAMRDIEHELALVLAPLPDRAAATTAGMRLLRWRRFGGPARRLWYRPAHGSYLSLNSDRQRLQFGKGDATIRIECPDPVITSDGYTLVSFTGGDTQTITNDGTLAAIYPTGWSYFASGTAGIQNMDHPEELILTPAPAGENVSCPRNLEIVTDTTAGVAYGATGIGGQWPILRPGANQIKAIAGPLDLKVWSTW